MKIRALVAVLAVGVGACLLLALVVVRFGPVALTNTLTTNILNPGAGARSTPPVGYTDTVAYILLRHIRIVNKTAGAVTCSFWLGATAGNVAGTEVIGQINALP